MEKLNVSEKYDDIDTSAAWEDYWEKTSKLSTPILWDKEPELGAALDLPQFEPLIDACLPLIDLACGNGTQTYFLASKFPQVIGVDVSKSALEIARSQHSRSNIQYRLLDALKPKQAAALHAEIGDANIYMRTGFHHIPIKQRPQFVRSLEQLLGSKGILYLTELGYGALECFNSVIEMHGRIPEELALVTEHGLRPSDVTIDDLKTSFPNFDILLSGTMPNHGILKLPNGDYVTPPAIYAVLRPAHQ
ncbi:MAG: class I SAM-dependent methyltransferase [Cyanobacteriota bacterium]|nr:class I SAM-dependent methyltransferase [Cyanobacteriota bacterium]